MDVLAIIAERRVREAMERGEFANLAGEGKPLDMSDDVSGVPPELRMAYKVLKNAGFAPPEVELRREIVSLREMLAGLEDGEKRRSVHRELEYKLLKFNLMRKRPMNLDDFPDYREKVIQRLGG